MIKHRDLFEIVLRPVASGALVLSLFSCGPRVGNVDPDALLSARARSDLREGVLMVARGEASKGYGGRVDGVCYKASSRARRSGSTVHVPVIISTDEGKKWYVYDYPVDGGGIAIPRQTGVKAGMDVFVSF